MDIAGADAARPYHETSAGLGTEHGLRSNGPLTLLDGAGLVSDTYRRSGHLQHNLRIESARTSWATDPAFHAIGHSSNMIREKTRRADGGGGERKINLEPGHPRIGWRRQRKPLGAWGRCPCRTRQTRRASVAKWLENAVFGGLQGGRSLPKHSGFPTANR